MNSYQSTAAKDLERLRRKRRNRIVVVAFFCMLAVIAVLESPLTRVRSIAVFGNTSIPSNKLVQEANLRDGESVWQVSAGKIQTAIMKQEPLVESVQVHTDFVKGAVSLTVAQKKTVAILQARGAFYNLLSDGTVYSQLSSAQGFSLPIITESAGNKVDIGEKVKDSDVTILCKALSTLQEVQVEHMSQFTFDGLGSTTLYMDNGYEVELSVDELPQQLGSVQSVVSYFSDKGYAPGLIDMSGQPPYRYTPFPTGKGK